MADPAWAIKNVKSRNPNTRHLEPWWIAVRGEGRSIGGCPREFGASLSGRHALIFADRELAEAIAAVLNERWGEGWEVRNAQPFLDVTPWCAEHEPEEFESLAKLPHLILRLAR